MSDPKGERRKSNISKIRHDLRTPINQLIGYSQMLQEDLEERGHEDLLPDVAKIESASRKMMELIDEHLHDGVELTEAVEAGPEPAPPTAAAPEPSRPQDAPTPPEWQDSESSVKVLEALRAREEAGGPLPPASLLVVDDDAMNRDMLARRLQRKGFAVEVACDGHDALAKLESGDFQLVLLDVMMPGISGLEVLRKVRSDRSVADLPIIMATAMDASEDVVQALRDGANDYVTKPLDFQVVLARVETQLALKRAKDKVQMLAEELEKRNRFIRKTFGRFISDEVVDTLLESPEGLRLGGERREVTILTCDLRGFTALAETLTAEQLVSILNGHLGRMADLVMSYGGTVDEFIGDEVLALFGAPMSHPDDAERAVACAVAMQQAVATMNEDHRARGLPEFEMGVAVNTGEVVVGNIGSDKRMKYGVVGSHVNLTARIESLTVGGQILVSESTIAKAGPNLLLGGQVAVRAKGFKELITAYELKGIGEPHNLMVPEKTVELIDLARGIAVQYSIIEGKQVESTVHQGTLTKLSLKGAEVRAPASPELLSNLSIRLVGTAEESFPEDLYAKVVDRTPGGTEWFAVTFTWVPPHVQKYFQALMAP